MVIYLKHPVHGNKVACAEAEAVYDELHGWVRIYNPDTPAPTPVAPVEQVKRKYTLKLRKEPDHG